MAALIAIVIVLFFIFAAIKRITEYERAVIFRLGRLLPNPKGPGIVLVFPIVDQVTRMSLRTETLDVPPQDIITRDNVTATVSAVVYYRILDPAKALVKVNNYRFATSQFAQTTLRSVLGEVEFDDLLSSRDKINARLQTIVDERTETWGVKVENVEIKTVDLPQELQRAIARQAEAERERRAKIIHADGEFAAAQKLADASAVMAKEPIALQLRYLQTLTEIGSEKNTTIVFPVPIDVFEALLESRQRKAAGAGGSNA